MTKRDCSVADCHPLGDQFGVYWTAGALALGSSTDNFAIGASLGISGLMLKLKFNALIAAANALGAFVAAAGGLAIGQMANSFGLWIAAFVFGYLAWQGAARSGRVSQPRRCRRLRHTRTEIWRLPCSWRCP